MKRLLVGWSLMRAIRLLLGVAVIWQAIGMREWVLAGAGALLSLMAIFNMGCCTVNTFAEPGSKPAPREIVYEEVES